MEQFLGGVCAVLGKATVNCQNCEGLVHYANRFLLTLRRLHTMNAVGQEVLAVQQFPLPAEMAVPAKLRVICSYFVANFESLHVLPNLYNDSTCLVPGHDRHCRIEVTIMDVKIGTANPTGLNYSVISTVLSSEPRLFRTFDENFVALRFWHRHCHQREILDLIVSNCFHFRWHNEFGRRAIGDSVRCRHFGIVCWKTGGEGGFQIGLNLI